MAVRAKGQGTVRGPLSPMSDPLGVSGPPVVRGAPGKPSPKPISFRGSGRSRFGRSSADAGLRQEAVMSGTLLLFAAVVLVLVRSSHPEVGCRSRPGRCYWRCLRCCCRRCSGCKRYWEVCGQKFRGSIGRLPLRT